jgi:hypothetical protein
MMKSFAKLSLRVAIINPPDRANFNVARGVALPLLAPVQAAGVGGAGVLAKIVIAHAGMNARIAVLRTAQD